MKMMMMLLLLLTTGLARADFNPYPYTVLKGGSGAVSFTAHGVLLGEGTSAFVPLTIANNQLLVGVTGSDPVSALLVDANVSGSAAIAYSKLNLALSIVNGDINASAAIAFSKLAALSSGNILVGSAGNVATSVAMSGDATIVASGALTLATVNSNVGSFTNANITVDAKGRITAAASGTTPLLTVVDGGNAAYSILAGDGVIRDTTTLTADRAYTLTVCNASNIGEVHRIKNLPAQTKNIILTAAGSDNIDGNATYTVYPGDGKTVRCDYYSGSAGTWDLE